MPRALLSDTLDTMKANACQFLVDSVDEEVIVRLRAIPCVGQYCRLTSQGKAPQAIQSQIAVEIDTNKESIKNHVDRQRKRGFTPSAPT